MQKITKENVLEKLDQRNAFEHFLAPLSEGKELKPKRNFRNPLIKRRQKTGSFNYHEVSPGNYRYHDYQTGEDGDIFDLVQKIKGCNFYSALQIINEEMNLGLKEAEKSEQQTWNVNAKEWTKEGLKYWEDYGINSNTLDQLQIKELSSYQILKNGQIHQSFSTAPGQPAFAYLISHKTNTYKIYQPFAKDRRFKFRYIGPMPEDYCFGLDSLPEHVDKLIICAGEKDNAALRQMGYNAVNFSSESVVPSEKLIQSLRGKSSAIYVLYDLDKTGEEKARVLCEKFGFLQLKLPEYLKSKGGKDVADYCQLIGQFELDELSVIQHKQKLDPILTNLLEIEEQTFQLASTDIVYPEPLMAFNNVDLLEPNTINTIKGQTGTHKSRLASYFASELLRKPGTPTNPLGIKKEVKEEVVVCYVDTERNLKHQFPGAIKRILIQAGHDPSNAPSNFRITSLLQSKREDRFNDLKLFIDHVRKGTDKHIVIILDVITDCVRDFNSNSDTQQLIDMMNQLINTNNATFICIIHENPSQLGGGKARGHLGTELHNKSSQTIEINFEKDQIADPTLRLIRIKFEKIRNDGSFEPFYAVYDQNIHQLVLADDDLLQGLRTSRQKVGPVQEIIDVIRHNKNKFEQGIQTKLALDLIWKSIEGSENTLRSRLDQLCEEQIEIEMDDGKIFRLTKTKQGNKNIFQLHENNSHNSKMHI